MADKTGGAAFPDGPIREGDIFRFWYSDEYRKKLFEPHHCFDGQLVAVKRGDDMILADSYWLHGFQYRGGESGKTFTLSEAQEKGELTFVCNLSEVQKRDALAAEYYDDSDVFDLSYQHRCYTYIAIRKDAVKSQAKMRRVLNNKIAEHRRAIESATSSIEWLSRNLQKVEDGRLEEAYL